MGQGSLRLLDSEGREILGAIDDQPLRVELELDIDPDSAPDLLKLEVIGPTGKTEILEAERIDWGAERPLYRSDLTTVEEIFSRVLPEALDPRDPIKVNNGESVRFEYDDLETSVQVFETGLDARTFLTRAAIADRIQETTNAAIRLTGARKKLQDYPESDLRDQLERLIEERLGGLRASLRIFEQAKTALDNPKYYQEQQIQVAQNYMTAAGRGLSLGEAHLEAHERAAYAKEIVHNHIVSGVKDIVIGGYRMFVNITGAAQLRTLVTGENEMGQQVGWDGRAVAFLDLLSQGLLMGASMKFQLDHLVAPTRTGLKPPASRTRYDGPDPAKNAPEGAIVDPTQMGMPPAAIRAAFRASRMHNRYSAVRPTNPDSLAHLEAGALPKMEALKSKTIGEIDTLLGAAPESRGLVGLFEPKTGFFETALRSSGMSNAQVRARLEALRKGARIDPPPGYAGKDVWNAAVKRYHQRNAEYHGATGKATFKLEADGVIRIEDGVILDAATGKPFAGDHDLFDFIDAAGLPVTPEIYQAMLGYLQKSAFRAQHGAHARWNPQRSDFPPGAAGDAKYEVARQIYEGIIASHQGQEILIVFPPVGPPVALYAGTAPGPYLGHMPGGFTPAAPGSSLMLPTEVFFWGAGGTTSADIEYDESVREWTEAEAELKADLESEADDDSTNAFDEMAAAAEARIAALDSALEADDDYDLDEFQAETDPTTGVVEPAGDDAGTDAFDSMEAAAEAQIAALDSALEADDDYDLDEFQAETDTTTGVSETAGDDGGTDAFDAMEAAAEARIADLDSALEADDDYDLDEFQVDGASAEAHVSAQPSAATANTAASWLSSHWAWIVGAIGGLGILATAGLSLLGGSDTTAGDPPGGIAAVETVATTEAITAGDETASVEAGDSAGVAGEIPATDVDPVPFPELWVYTATKVADSDGEDIGLVIEWYVPVIETCSGDACTYTSVVQALEPRNVLGEIPDATWAVEGPEWSLDAIWAGTPTTYPDGTSCAAEAGWSYRFTVTETDPRGGREIPTAFVGTWEQAFRRDLGASTGDLSLCPEFEHLAEWSVVGITGNA